MKNTFIKNQKNDLLGKFLISGRIIAQCQPALEDTPLNHLYESNVLNEKRFKISNPTYHNTKSGKKQFVPNFLSNDAVLATCFDAQARVFLDAGAEKLEKKQTRSPCGRRKYNIFLMLNYNYVGK